MKTFHISVTNQTEMNNQLKYYALIMIPILGLLFYNQKFHVIEFTGYTELIVTIALTLTPTLILGIKLRSAKSEENVSFGNGEIHTDLFGPIKFFEIREYKSPTTSKWNKDIIRVYMKNGMEIIFSPIVRQFRNKQNKKEFEEFVSEFERNLKSSGYK